MYGTKPNDLLQFGYLDLGKSITGDRYVLMTGDDHIGYAWVYLTSATNAEEATYALINEYAALRTPLRFMFDSPTNFETRFYAFLPAHLNANITSCSHIAHGVMGQ